MRRVLSLTLVLIATTVLGGRWLDAQTPAPPRDPVPPPAQAPRDPNQPIVRNIPVGTATISGVVTNGDGGRPIAGVRVMLSGTVTSAGARGGATPGLGPVSVPSAATPSIGVNIGAGQAAGGGSGGIGRGTILVGGAGGIGGGSVQISGGPLAISPSGVSRTQLTDAQGQFSFQKLPAGQFRLSANRNQFLTTSYGQKRPGAQGATITVADGQKVTVSLPMVRGGVITGLVTGDDGEPQPGAQIRAMRYSFTNGVRRLQQTGGSTADDRGIYRLFGLQPGDYLVSATPNSSDLMNAQRVTADAAAMEDAIAKGPIQPPAAPGLPSTVAMTVTPPQQGPQGPIDMPAGYLPTYAPDTPIASSATTIHVNGGDERTDVDIRVQLVQASNVQGTVTAALGPGVSIQVSLINDDPTADSVSPTSTRVGPDGKFAFRTVAPGKYTVMAQTVAAPPPPTMVNGVITAPQLSGPPRLDDSQKMWGRATVTVEGQSSVAVNLGLQPGKSISGVVQFEMERAPDLTRQRVMVTLASAPSATTVSVGQPPQAQVGQDGRFTLNGVVPGKYLLRASGGGTMKSSMIGSDDTLDLPLDFTGERDISDAVLTMTDKSSQITGTLTDAAGKPVSDYMVVVVPTDPKFWTPGSRRIAAGSPSPDGHFAFPPMPPGDYFLAAVADLEQGGQFDPEFLKTIGTAAMRVSLAEGQKLSQDLRVAAPR